MSTTKAGTLETWAIHTGGGAEVSAVRFLEAMITKHSKLFAQPVRTKLPRAGEEQERRVAVTPAEVDEILSLYRQGIKCRLIAAKTGRSITTVTGILWRRGLRMKGQREDVA